MWRHTFKQVGCRHSLKCRMERSQRDELQSMIAMTMCRWKCWNRKEGDERDPAMLRADLRTPQRVQRVPSLSAGTSDRRDRRRRKRRRTQSDDTWRARVVTGSGGGSVGALKASRMESYIAQRPEIFAQRMTGRTLPRRVARLLNSA
jgi:hypothetical protein